MKLISETFLKITQTPGTRHPMDDAIGPVLCLQKMIGHQILDPSWTWRKNALKLTSIILLIIYVIIGTIDLMQTTDDFFLFSEAVFTLVIIFQFTFTFYPFAYYRFTFRKLYFMTKTSIFYMIEEISPKRSVYFAALLKIIAKVAIISVLTPTFQYVLPALWFYINGEKVNLSPSTSTLMPERSPYFEIALILHAIFFIAVASGSIATNTWFALLTLFPCEACDCAVKILEKKIERTDDATYAKSLNDSLAKFYSVHVTIVKYIKKINIMFKWVMLVPMIAAYTLTCTCMLVMTQEVNWKLVSIVILEFVEISAFNILGERIKTKAEQMKMALLNFDWMSMRLKDRKNYLIIMSYMNRDFGITTAVGVDLSLLTLSNIYKGSYQAYAVFNTMNN